MKFTFIAAYKGQIYIVLLLVFTLALFVLVNQPAMLVHWYNILIVLGLQTNPELITIFPCTCVGIDGEPGRNGSQGDPGPPGEPGEKGEPADDCK